MDIQEILHLIQSNDSEESFRTLFDMQYERMYRIAYYFLQNDEWAEDVVLDVLAEIWTKRKTMVIPNDFRHYSFVAVKNKALNLLTREEKHRAWQSDMNITDAGSITIESPDTLLEQAELFETYEQLLSELPERCREVFCRIKEDGASYAEVAAQMGITVKTVDAQLQKALKYLREGLQKYQHRESGKRFFALFL